MIPAESIIPPALCPACGAALPGGKWSGICPRCLMAALGEEEEAENSSAEAIVPGYTVLEEISRGGMGVVYRAQQHHPHRIVALKMILPHLLDSPNVRARFQAEVEAVAKLDHPNVLPIYEAGENRGTPYLAMKFIPGGSLAEQRGEFLGRQRDCARLVAAAARGVQHAHERGVLHRDIKPANLLLDNSASDAAPVPMVSDFGLARALEYEPGGLTGPASMLGTVGYLAPELIFGSKSGPTVQSDIYSLGTILFELLAGRLPFGGETGLEVLRRADQEAVPSVRTADPGVAKDLDAICRTCLQREPASRYRSAAALADDLECFLEARPVRARPVPRLVRVTRWARRKPALAALSLAVSFLLIAAIVGSALFIARVSRERDRAAASGKDAQAQLWRAYLEQARATRIAPQVGRRFAALEALSSAARIRPSLELRNAAAAALGLEDLALERRWPAMRASIDAPVAFDQNLERYAVPQTGGRISLRRFSDNLELANFPAPQVEKLLFSNDGRFLAGRVPTGETWLWAVPADSSTGSGIGFQSMDQAHRQDADTTASPMVVLKLTGTERISEVAFTPDSRLFTVSGGPGELVFYDLTETTPHERARWTGLPRVRGLSFDPRGQRLALTGERDAVAEIRETATGRLIRKLVHPAVVMGVDWSPDGSELTTGSEDFQVRIWDAQTGALRHVLEGHQNVSVRPRYHPGGHLLATAGWDAILRFWSPQSGRLIFNGPACDDWQRFSPDGTHLAVANYDGAIELYRVATGRVVRMFEPKTAEAAPPLHLWLDFSPDSRRLVSAGAEGVRLWDVASGVEAARCLPLHGVVALTFLFAGDNDALLVADENGGVTRRPMLGAQPGANTWGIPETWRTGEGWATASRTPNGRVVLINSLLGVAEIVSKEHPQSQRIGPHPFIHSATLSPDGMRLVTGTWHGNDVKIWNVADGQLLATLPAGESAYAIWQSSKAVISVQMNEAAEWVEDAPGAWRRGRVWRPETGHTFWVHAVISPDGRWLALPQSGDHIRLVDTATGEELVTLEPPKPMGLGFVRFSPNGRFLAACGARQQVAVWELPELRRELARLRLDWTD